MKRVSFEVAKAIKEVGYPQDYKNAEDTYTNLNGGIWVKPTYLEVRLWLWRNKNMRIKDTYDGAVWVWSDKIKSPIYIEVQTKDPEEAIISAIDYLVEHNMIK